MQPIILWDEEFGTRTLHMVFGRFLPRFVADPKQFKLSTINAKAETSVMITSRCDPHAKAFFESLLA